jgi:hypothetical protein
MREHKPCDIALIEKDYPEFTVCQVFRTIYRKTEDEETKTLCGVGVSMAKAMSQALEKYKERVDGK